MTVATGLQVLHLGCGRKAKDRLNLPDSATIITLDLDPNNEPDIVCCLGRDPIPLPDDSVDAAIAIHVLEHIGRQGETDSWFYFWEELYRVLKPNGQLHLESPLYNSVWAWADPQHSRAMSTWCFVYFDQDSYRIPGSRITPYRIKADFKVVGEFQGIPDGNEAVKQMEGTSHFRGVLEAKKPLQPWWTDVS